MNNIQYIGNIYKPPFDGSWKDNSALTPTPFLLDLETIRIFTSFRDPSGTGRIGFIDVSAHDPSLIKNISEEPVVDIGEPGCFDDNGMILGDVISCNSQLHLYYVGFQIPTKCKFLAFSGLAISNNNGISFKKYSSIPILDRKQGYETINAIHTVLEEKSKNIFRVWCGAGNSWIEENNNSFPSYRVTYIESPDGINFSSSLPSVHIPLLKDEYRLGRPRVYKLESSYLMLFTYAKIGESYQIGFATSPDGYIWERNKLPPFTLKESELKDCGLISYPTFINAAGNKYIFFNGSDMGFNGIYCAKIYENFLF